MNTFPPVVIDDVPSLLLPPPLTQRKDLQKKFHECLLQVLVESR